MEKIEILPGFSITSDNCALFEGDTLVLADLHIGYESVLEEEGFHLPRIQTQEIIDRLMTILDRYRPDRIVVLGDFKHEFSRNLHQEWNDVRQILSTLMDFAEVDLVRGNHDNYLATIASRMDIEVVDRLSINGVCMVHGHQMIEDRPLIMAHEHPSIRIFDSVGACIKLPCFVHFPREQVVVLPAFSPLASGTDLTATMQGDFLSPILSRIEVEEAEIYACSEIGLLPLGHLSGIKRIERVG